MSTISQRKDKGEKTAEQDIPGSETYTILYRGMREMTFSVATTP